MSEDSEKVAGMAIMSMARDIDNLKAENERLRGLLREILGKNRCRDMWLWNEDLHKRIREALGEEIPR